MSAIWWADTHRPCGTSGGAAANFPNGPARCWSFWTSWSAAVTSYCCITDATTSIASVCSVACSSVSEVYRALSEFLDGLGYPYTLEHDNPAYRFFLG